MPGGRRRKSSQRYTEDAADRRSDWFARMDSAAETIAGWDCKTEALGECILTVLAQGGGIAFSRSRSGDSVGITLYSGEDRKSKWIDDSIAFDDYIAGILIAIRADLDELGETP